MAVDRKDEPPEAVESGLQDMKLDTSTSSSDDEPLNSVCRTRAMKIGSANSSVANSPKKPPSKSTSRSPTKPQSSAPSPITSRGEQEEIIEGDIMLKVEPGQAPKLSRSTSQRAAARQPKLFDHLPSATPKATELFEVIKDCIYAAKYLGASDHDGLECDCVEEWDGSSNKACGDDSDCINRATKMECVEGECNCGSGCQNQRFQRKQYASVSVIETEKKGYGLRADSDLNPHDFIFEYVGEVINETQFRRRMIQYDEEGIKHFYFMSLSKGEFVDATRKGNLGRFCNHSCRPNCYVDKWIVGDKLRMGIFAGRRVKAGEELVFNYNVDRYGADPQPCYCGEPNCTGYIGGRTQTERATKLSPQTIEALGIEDGDGWDTTVPRKSKKKKQAEDDEEYVNNAEPKVLDEKGVTTVMATLVQCKEKWIFVKLLGRIQRCDDERVLSRVVKMHGYQILNPALVTWKEDFNVVLQILDILNKFPRITRNKITDSKIDETVKVLTTCGDEKVQDTASALLKEWSTLEVGYRIPRKKRDENSTSTPDRLDHFQRRETSRDEEKERRKSRSPEPPKGPAAPTGPRNSMPQRNPNYFSGSRPAFKPSRVFQQPLPSGWYMANDNGKTYYYSASGQPTWVRPTMPAYQPPPQPKPMSNDQRLQEIIDSITKNTTPKEKAAAAAAQQPAASEAKREKKSEGHEKWRSLSEEKKKKLYENTLFPHVKYVMDKFKGKLPREELKRFGKEIAKKIVNSDFKNNRVEDPSQISSKQERQVKKYVKEYFDKAVLKKREHDKKKAERKAKLKDEIGPANPLTNCGGGKDENSAVESEEEQVMDMSEDEEHANKSPSVAGTSGATDGDGLKRKREDEMELEEGIAMDDDSTPSKKIKSEASTPPPPPPPPPPPADQDEEQVMEESSYAGMDGFDESQHFSPDTPGQDTTGELGTVEPGDFVHFGHTVEPSTPQASEQALADEHHEMKENVMVFKPGILQTSSEISANDVSNGNDSQYEGMNPERLRLLGIV